MRKDKKSNRHVVYRHFDKDGNLLYLGCTEFIPNRNMQHQNVACWYKDIATITLENFDNWEDAAEAETKYIHSEKPKYNKRILQPKEKAVQKELRNKKAFLWLTNEWQHAPYGEISEQSLKAMVAMGIAETRKNEMNGFWSDYRLIAHEKKAGE